MKLASYSPDVTRLRRVAKACAAGEMSRSEYRQARREVIENLANRGSSRDDTVPRFGGDTTVRRNFDVTPVAPPNNTRLNLLWLLLLAVVLAALTFPGVARSQALTNNIPAVQARPADPEKSPRYKVVRVVWSVPTGWQRDISAPAAQDLLDDALREAQAVHRAGDNGFTVGELEQVARFLNAIGIHESAVQTSREDMLDLKALVARQKSERYVSLAQLEGIAARLQTWVRKQGFTLAVAYVPAQEVSAGQVQLQVVLGELALVREMHPQSGDFPPHSDPAAGWLAGWAGQFSDLLGRPVQRTRIESRLNLLNRAAADTLQASFSQGEEVGTTELNLQISPAAKFSGLAQLDNFGLAAFGQERLSYSGSMGGLVGVADRLDLHISSALGDEDYLRGGIRYTLPWGSENLTLSGQLGYADAVWQQDLEGRGVRAQIDATHTLAFTRRHRRELVYGVSWQDVKWSGLVPLDQKIWSVSARGQGHQLWDERKTSVQAEFGLSLGGVDNPLFGQDSSFVKLDAEFFAWKVLSGWLDKAVVRGRAQWSADDLPATQKMSVSHPYANPGIEPFGQTVDSLLEVGTEVHFDAPLGTWWVFVDANIGGRNDATDSWYQLATAGLGWQAELFASEALRVNSRVTLGHPLVHKSNGVFSDDGTQIFWSVRVSH